MLSVLQSTQASAGELEGIVAPVDWWVQSIASGTDNCPPIVAALASFFTVQGGRLEGMGRRVSAALQGASDATLAYEDNDVTMALTHQRAAAVLAVGPSTGDMVAE